MVAHALNPSTWEAVSVEVTLVYRVLGQPGLLHRKTVSKKKKKRKRGWDRQGQGRLGGPGL